MRTEGQTLTCDVCGASVFLKYEGEGASDGGFSRWRNYERPPEGWNGADVRGIGDLCPECSARVRAAIEAAISDRKAAGE